MNYRINVRPWQSPPAIAVSLLIVGSNVRNTEITMDLV